MQVCFGICIQILVNVIKRSDGKFFNPLAMKYLNINENIQQIMMFSSFNDNPSATILFCYSPINASIETSPSSVSYLPYVT